jgi:hypothetical protein
MSGIFAFLMIGIALYQTATTGASAVAPTPSGEGGAAAS